ncbi:MAG: hypothetical protein HYX47_05785 [Burkholderiales bacterium]|nr:hypothetical protein [Burkholderiales bacterium]
MSLISWLFQSKPAKAAGPAAESSGLSRMEATRPVNASHRRSTPPKQTPPASNAQPANRKSERMARRELLYTVVRDSMVHAGVLSSSYKFKVLSLDARGRQFLVMVDLAREFGSETGRLAEVEAMIAQSAKSRYDIVVTAVYWRMNEHVAVGNPAMRGQLRPAMSSSQPMPLESPPAALESRPMPIASQPAPLVSQPAPLTAVRPQGAGRYEPIQADEVAAFKRALAAGASKPAASVPVAVPVAAAAGATAKAFDGSGKHGPQSYTLLTGFEDTEMPDGDARSPALSGTQYGELN